jgi:hypothetical protein
MGRQKWLGALCAVLGLAAAGCGTSSSSPSGADPAQVAPGGSVAYVELTVRPQGSARDQTESAFTKLLGHSPDRDIRQAVTKTFKGSGLNYSRDIEPWLGQRVGIAVGGFKRDNVAFIAPTSNTDAALAALKRGDQDGHFSARTYRGVAYQSGTDKDGVPLAYGIVGHNAVIGGPSEFTAIVDASHGGGLAGSSALTGAFSSLAPGAIVRAYVNGPAVARAIRTSALSVPKLGSVSPQQLKAGLAQLRGNFALAVAATSQSLTVEVHSTMSHKRSGAGSDVSGLPGQSWLALAAALSPKTAGLAALEQSPQTAAMGALLKQRFGVDLAHDLLPALGPLQLSIQGTSPATVGAGLVITPFNAAAAGRVLAAIYRQAGHSSSLSVKGKPSAFTVTSAGSPLPRVDVAKVGARILATFDETFSQLLSPSSKLSANVTFGRVRSALPAGSRVPLFIDFGAIKTLVSQIPSFADASGKDHKAYLVLQRLDYLALAGTAAGNDVRLVLGLR